VLTRQHLIEAITSISTINVSELFVPQQGFSDITLDSRTVSPNSVFVAVQGLQVHGKKYVADAIKKGVKLILLDIGQHENEYIQKTDSTFILHIQDLGKKLGHFLTILFPQIKNLSHVMAVTGTNGKTSVANIYAQMAFELGYKAASIGTLGVYIYDTSSIGRKYKDTTNTTPDVVQLFSTLALLADMKIGRVAIEASSHGIAQGRLNDLPIGSVIFTNLTQDHLDYHKSMERYAHAKRSILHNQFISCLVYNADDNESQNWLQQVSNNIDTIGYSLVNKTAEINASDISYASDGLRFTLKYKNTESHIKLPLLGRFNIYNYLSVIASFLHQGVNIFDLQKVSYAIKGINGRMELTQFANKTVLVDYAHTPDALQQALLCAKQHTTGEVWVVFGCGGDRDKDKRDQMGGVASQYADHIVLTQDNPRTETPQSIISDILAGIKNSKLKKIENERASAVRYAIDSAKSGDTILLAGKGHENYIEINGEREFYDERALVKTIAEEYA